VGNTLHAKVLAFAFRLAVDIERSLIAARTREALARRRQAGQRLGRPPGSLSKQTKLTGRDEEIQLLLQKKVAVSAIARILGVHRTRLWPIKPLTGHHESRDREPLAEIACTLPRE
jgi:DNA invertase Pin-like site-specific DNA recombinase